MTTAYIDLETWPIRPGCAAPPPASVQFAFDGGPVTILSLSNLAAFEAAILRILRADRILGHNVAFDMAVLANHGFLVEVFQAYDEQRVECTMVNQRLVDIACDNGLYHKYSLDVCCARNEVPVEVNKAYEGRCTYNEVAYIPPVMWSSERNKYAHDDIIALRGLDNAHTEARAADILVRAGWFARNSFWLYLMTVHGIHTDQEQVERYHKVVQKRIDKEKAWLIAEGLVWSGKPVKVKGVKMPKYGVPGARNTAAAKDRMLWACEELDLPVPRTDKGSVCLDKEACDNAADELLTAYQEYGSAKGRLTRIDNLRMGLCQPAYMYPQDTARTSSRADNGEGLLRGDQIQNPPKEPGYRECYIAGPRYLLCSTDFPAFELSGLSQAVFDKFARSSMADAINQGKDVHSMLCVQLAGALEQWEITYEDFRALVKSGDHWAKELRALAKILNFGLGGGMGAATLAANCRRSGRKTFTEAQGAICIAAWKATWVEMKGYFKDISDALGDNSGMLIQTAGMHFRGGVGYCQAANHPFQSRCAYAACDAGWELTRECYLGIQRDGAVSILANSRPVIFLHDEFILRHPEEIASECAWRQAKVQGDAAAPWMPCIEPQWTMPEPALMYRWSKGADKRLGPDGRLVAWEPSDKNDKVKWGSGWADWFRALEADVLEE